LTALTAGPSGEDKKISDCLEKGPKAYTKEYCLRELKSAKPPRLIGLKDQSLSGFGQSFTRPADFKGKEERVKRVPRSSCHQRRRRSDP